jgi:DNA-binding transcriptional MerR regulator
MSTPVRPVDAPRRGRTPRPDPHVAGQPHADDPTPPHPLRIGDVARLVGTTPRTIRYYEEIGLLPEAPARPSGGHRTYTEAEVERLREVMRLKHLLGVTLEELKTLLAAEEARATVRAQLRREDVHPERRRTLLEEALGHIERQLALVEHRASELAKLREELTETRTRVRRKLRDLDCTTAAVPDPSHAT